MDVAGLAIGAVSLGGQLMKASIECYDIFTQISNFGNSYDSILHELQTEAFRLRQWEQGWNLGCPTLTRERQQHLDPNDVRYRYALASLARIVVGFARVAELNSTYSKELKKVGKSKKPVKNNNTLLAPVTGTQRITRSRSKSPLAHKNFNVSDLTQKLNQLKFWENPKCLEDPQALPGLAEEIASLNEVTNSVQKALPGYRKLRWVLIDKEEYSGIVHQLKKYIDGLSSILPPLPAYFPSNLPQTSTPKTLQLSFKVPFKIPKIQKDSHFVQRGELNKRLKNQIDAGTGSGNINQVVLHGAGGMGKTQLVLNYVSYYHQEYSAVFWINAATEQAIRRAFVEVMQRLIQCHTQLSDSPTPDYIQIGRLLGMVGKLDSARSGAFNVQNPAEEQHVIEAVKEWLAAGGNTQWLLVFDNLDDLESFNLSEYIPPCWHGTIIITTRRPESVLGRAGLEIHQMEDSEAQKLLLRSSHRKLDSMSDTELKQEQTAIAAIMQKLGSLPLALDHAGSYIFKQQCTFTTYLEQLEANIDFHLSKGWKQGDNQESVFASWDLSFEVLRKRVPKATELLSICGFLDNEDICEEFLRRGMKIENNQSEFEESIQALFSYSFAKRKHSDKSIYIHPLIHMWARNRLMRQPGLYLEKLLEALQVISSALGPSRTYATRSSGDWQFERRYMPHIVAIECHIDQHVLSVDHVMSLADCMVHLGLVCNYHARYTRAIEWFQRVLPSREKRLGVDHLDTLTTVFNIADVFDSQGKYDMALEYYQRVLAGEEKQLGTDHPHTLSTMHNMAVVFISQGKYDMALEYYQRVLAGQEKQLGTDHPNILSTIYAMAVVFASQGKYDMALEYYQRVLGEREKQLGADHPGTLSTMHGMAGVFYSQGKYDMALEYYQRVLGEREKQLGADHPHTLGTMHGMAGVFYSQGKYDMALEYYQRVLGEREKQLGADHPNTLGTMHGMAGVFYSQGKYDMALEWYQRVLAGEEKQLGTDHPDTLITIHSMAGVFKSQGKYDMALEYYQRVLGEREKQLGADHPHTRSTMHGMAGVFYSQGNYDMALEWYQRVLAGEEKQLGTDHPDTLITIHSMAGVFKSQGKYDMALEYYQRVLVEREKQLGADHPDTLTTMHGMAGVFQSQGKYDMALEWYQRALAGREKQLGTDHPDTLTTIHSMAGVCDSQGKYDMALEYYQRALTGREKNLNADHPDLKATVRQLGQFYQTRQMFEEAERLPSRFPTAWPE